MPIAAPVRPTPVARPSLLALNTEAAEWLARPSAKTGKYRAPRTVEEYRKDLDERILPTFGKRAVTSTTDATGIARSRSV